MGHKVDFLALDEDLRSLLDFALGSGGLIVPDQSPTATFRPLSKDEFLLGDRWGYLTRADDIGKLRSHFLPERGLWFPDRDGQMIIHVMAPRRVRGQLNPGGLRYDPRYYGPRDEPLRLPDDFVRWADSIFRWVRRNFTRGPDGWTYVGPAAKAWLTEKGAAARR